MARSKQNQNPTAVARQKRVLCVMYVISFIISFAVVVAESVYYRNPVKVESAPESVAGVKIDSQVLLEDYRSKARTWMSLLARALNQDGISPSQDSLNSAYGEILATSVPDIYRDLHLKFVRMFLMLGSRDLDDLRPARAGYENLADEYSWLVN